MADRANPYPSFVSLVTVKIVETYRKYKDARTKYRPPTATSGRVGAAELFASILESPKTI
jgi:hypothetical protein